MKQASQITGNQLNWNQIYYFSEIASCGSIKDAAQKLGLSPSTLSEHLSELEDDLKVQLFHRQHRKLILTEQGTRLYLHAKQMFETGQRLIDVVSPIPLGSYPVAIGLIPSPGIQIAHRLIADFLENFGPLNMKIFHTSYIGLESKLVKAQLDFGFSDRISERKDLVSVPISSSFIKFYVSSKWWEHPFNDLIARLPLLICNSDPSTRTLAEQSLGEYDIVPHSVITSDYPSVLLELCQRGLGIGVFSEEPIRKMNIETLKSLRVPKDAPKLQDNLYATWARDAENTEAVKRIRQILPKGR